MAGKIFMLAMAIFLVLDSGCRTANTHEKARSEFRDYANAPLQVKNFYKDQHQRQTYQFAKSQFDQVADIMVQVKSADEEGLKNLEQNGAIKLITIWEAISELDKLKDESDPDFSLPNSLHAFQTAEAIRKDLPILAQKLGVDADSLDWFILAGLLHDVGKIDALLRVTPQWAVVGDSFPVGCKYSESNIFYDDFKANPDFYDDRFNSEFGVYSPHIGLDNLVMSFGHDEYIYQVLKDQGVLPKEALSMLRFHSFYPLHRENAYLHLLSPSDHEQLRFIRAFSPYDLYSKHEEKLLRDELAPFYKNLINKYFPPISGEPERLIAWPILQPVG